MTTFFSKKLVQTLGIFVVLIGIAAVSSLLVTRQITQAAGLATQPDNSRQPNNFWAAGYNAQWVSQTKASDWEGQKNDGDEYFDVQAGSTVSLTVAFKNTGNSPWFSDQADRQVSIAVYKDPLAISAPISTAFDKKGMSDYGKSYFHSSTWPSAYRVAALKEQSVPPGGTGTFFLQFAVPADAPSGRFREDISLASGAYWISNKTNGDRFGAAHIWVGFDVIGKDDEKAVYMLGLLNRDRASQGVPPLQLETAITAVSLAHSRDQAEILQNFSHIGSDGANLKQRLQRGGITGFYVWGECVAIEWGYKGSNWKQLLDNAEDMLFNETPPNDAHRKNILDKRFTNVGIGVYDYNGKLWITQDFVGR
ncbi:MAG: CAP domain-containing protein [bacterium]